MYTKTISIKSDSLIIGDVHFWSIDLTVDI